MATSPPPPDIHAPVIYKDFKHKVAGDNEYIGSEHIAISPRPGNTIQSTPDGLFAGHVGAGSIFYVAAAGVDAPTSGTKDVPFKTLDYCLAFIQSHDPLAADNLISNYYGVALKAGESFPMHTAWVVIGSVFLTFFGDPNYGDFDSPYIGGIANPAVMSDLLRPIVIPSVVDGNDSIMNGFRLQGVGSVTLNGVRIELPDAGLAAPDIPGDGSFGDYSDFVTAINGSSGQLELIGTIVNRAIATGPFGIFGVHARCTGARLTQFATQFRFGNQIMGPGTTSQILSVRKYFIKFYKDYFGNRQSNGFFNLGSKGSGLMSINWSEVNSMTVMTGKTNLATYPIVEDQVYGLNNYILNLNRDAQGRPINAECGLKL